MEFFFIISQILVLLASVSDILSFQFKSKKKILFCLIISSGLISAHYFFLGTIVAGALVFVSIIRFTIAYFTNKKIYMYLLLIANTVVLAAFYSNLFDLVMYLALCIIVFGVFRDKDRDMRRIMMIGTSLAILFNILIFSPMAILVESVFLISNFVGYYRFYIKDEKNSNFVSIIDYIKKTLRIKN